MRRQRFTIIFGMMRRADIHGNIRLREMTMRFFTRLLHVQTYSSGKNFDDMLADLRCNSGRMFNPDLVKLFDSENLQEKVRSLITKKAADSLRSQVKK